MKFISKNENYRSPQGKGWFKNPYVIPGRIVKQPFEKKYTVSFMLCVDEDAKRRVLEEHSITFNEFDVKALIEVDGQEVDLISHLQSGGAYDSSKVTRWGMPDYDELSNYFEEGFEPLTFVEGDFKFLAVDWALNVLKAEGLPLKEFFKLEEL